MKVDEYKSKERPKKKRMECVKEDFARQGVSSELTTEEGEWKRKAHCTQTKLGKGQGDHLQR